MEKKLATEVIMQTSQAKSSKSLWVNFFVVLQPATRSCRSQLFKIGVLKSFITLGQMFSCAFSKNFKNTFFLRVPSSDCFCKTLPNMNNAKAFLIDFYYWFQNSCHAQQFPFRVTLSIQVVYHYSYFLK